MQGLIFPVILLLIVALWGVLSSGRKFRKEFKRRGISWEDACKAIRANDGCIVVDTTWGPPRGLGHPAVWWVPAAVAAEDLGPALESTARLVKCPAAMKDADALRKEFAPDRVRLHGWEADVTLTEPTRR